MKASAAETRAAAAEGCYNYDMLTLARVDHVVRRIVAIFGLPILILFELVVLFVAGYTRDNVQAWETLRYGLIVFGVAFPCWVCAFLVKRLSSRSAALAILIRVPVYALFVVGTVLVSAWVYAFLAT